MEGMGYESYHMILVHHIAAIEHVERGTARGAPGAREK